MAEQQYVALRGGSFDGQVGLAPPPPGGLRYYVKDDDRQWSELYLYVEGQAVDHETHGRLRVMQFMGRDEESASL